MHFDEFYQSDDCTKKYKILYLTRDGRNKIEYNNSIDKHPYYEENNPLLPDKLPMKVNVLSYEEDIVTWLNTCLTQIVSNEKCSELTVRRLKNVIEQYIEFFATNLEK